MTRFKLHEAIALILAEYENRTASIQEIADQINKRSLYKRKDSAPVPAYQVMQRTKLSNGTYHHLFEYIEPNMVRLK